MCVEEAPGAFKKIDLTAEQAAACEVRSLRWQKSTTGTPRRRSETS
ncbi:hypothetical protein [Dactylosporangium sp. CA-092794]